MHDVADGGGKDERGTTMTNTHLIIPTRRWWCTAM
jgi:hypothetical protein